MSYVRLLTNGGHYGLSKVVGKVFPAVKVGNVYYVHLLHLEAHGAYPFTNKAVEFGFVDKVECERVSVWRAFWEWTTGR